MVGGVIIAQKDHLREPYFYCHLINVIQEKISVKKFTYILS